MATATRLLVVLFAAATMPAAAAQTSSDPARQQKPPAAATPQNPNPDTRGVPVDVARLRKALAEPPRPLIPSNILLVDLRPIPRFREEVEVSAPLNPLTLSFAEQLKASEKEGRDLAASVPNLQYLHPVNAVLGAHKAIRKALYNRKVSKARREVEAELRALLASQAAQQAAEAKQGKRDK